MLTFLLMPAMALTVAVPTSTTATLGPLLAKKNDACVKEATNSGALVPGNGTVEAYTNLTGPLIVAAKSGVTPVGYQRAYSKSIGAAVQIASYLTYFIINNPAYDTRQCAERCDANKDCKAFNVYFARDPKYEPNENSGCDDLTPITNVKCALFSDKLVRKDATNKEQSDGPAGTGFVRVAVGSSAYNKLANSNSNSNSNTITITRPGNTNQIATFTQTRDLKDKAILAQDNSYLGYRTFADHETALQGCAQACVDASSSGCITFDSYVLLKNGRSEGNQCALYSKSQKDNTATNAGYQAGNDRYTIQESVVYELA
ncbi:hypothetical protein CC80DRAFT_563852 [Byssothecium circinans]|uniref:Apple domain-containing protein n=1 Tax=Byssothecium circinans TaxID=147558 RepID=A0A6A5TTK2_9PLEO|nr:hypothetical protein CC80DRAFT_563852 [Byssothecium circinans]